MKTFWRDAFLSMVVAGLTSVTPSAAQETGDDFYEKEFVRRRMMLKASAVRATGEGLDVTFYKLDVRVASDPPSIRGIVTLDAIATVGGRSRFVLDLTQQLTVDSVVVNGIRAVVVRTGNTVEFDVGQAVPAASKLTIAVAYGGLPDTTQGSIRFRSAGGAPWIWTLSEPYGARDWWPCKDHPADKADSLEVRATVRSDLKVGSEGILEAVIDNGDGTKTHVWKHRYPISTYLVSLAIGPYAEFTNWFRYAPTDSMPVLNYVLPTSLAAAQAQLPVTVRALEIFSEKFGLYPFIKEKYGHAQFGWGGGMEHQTMTSLIGFGEYLVAHELAHQWFGDMITMETWPHLWLNEGFATYCEAIHQEEKYGLPSYWGVILSRRNSARQAIGSVYLRDTSDFNGMFDSRRVYAKGGWILHMLRGVVGDSVFFAGLKSYANDLRFKFKTATTEHFRSVMETASGQNLGYFFDQWVYGERYPVYTYGWRWEAVGGGSVILSLQQSTGTTNPSVFAMPIRIALYRGGTSTVVTVWNNALNQSFSVPCPVAPDSVTLDPEGWILRDVQRTASFVVENSNQPHTDLLYEPYPNPFNPTATIVVDLPLSTDLSLRIFDMTGREVAILWNGPRSEGIHLFQWNAGSFASGTYLAELKTSAVHTSRKIILVR